MRQKNNMQVLNNYEMNEIERQFNHTFPYLQINILDDKGKKQQSKAGMAELTEVNGNRLAVDYNKDGFNNSMFVIDESMTVAELEKLFLDDFGCRVEVFRKCGNVWLKTKLTSDWTLKEQNQMGEDIS